MSLLNMTRHLRRHSTELVLPIVALVLLFAGCNKSNRYELKGQVVTTNPMTYEVTIKHEDIRGYMPAMTMPFKLQNPGLLSEIKPGDHIDATLVVAKDGRGSWLEDVRIHPGNATDQASAQTVRTFLAPGQGVPNIPLTNQDGRRFRLEDFKGKALLLTFVYSRCPVPTFCPRLSSAFAKIHQDLGKAPIDYERTHLVTISFDPEYDTAPVLRRYGLAYLGDDPSGFAHWDFASTTSHDLRKLAEAFGLEYFRDGNQINHTMVIVLVNPDGKIAKYWSTRWTASDLEEALRQAGRATTENRKIKSTLAERNG